MKLLDGWNIYDTFNVGHLHSYFDEFEEQNSRASSFSEEGNDDVQDINPISPTIFNIDEDHEEKSNLRRIEHPKYIKIYTRRNKP